MLRCCGLVVITQTSADANQKVIGEGMKEFLAQGKRGELFITSKIWNDEHRPADVR